MLRNVKIDPFFDDQPEKAFIEELKTPVHTIKPRDFGARRPRPDEVDAAGFYLAERFPEDGDLLEAVYADVERFAMAYGLAGQRYPIRIRKGDTPCFEAWRIDCRAQETIVTADDAEGVRRALIFLEDEMIRREGAFLPRGTTSRAPRMTARITRCFFSPINRPPKYGDELSDDIDYYPDEYLNRLMHDGANGLWIYTRFSDLVPSRFLSTYGQGGEARIEKLRRVIAKCARYGIRVYIFAIEPVALSASLSKELPEADGGKAWDGGRYFCVNSPEGRAFVEEAGRTLFTLCPGLGGLISITYGERPTSCASAYQSIPDIDLLDNIVCPRCRTLSPGQAVANAAAALAAGVHQASPGAEVISWTYGHRMWPIDDIRDYVRRAPDDVILMQNFEEMGRAPQLGQTRQGVDYWLSYVGPSDRFDATAKQAMASGKRLFMKIQACCSHEVATVPYLPVPGLLFDKYKAARELGVTGVMQCWYFGNYPSMMSKAAGELAFLDNFSDKRAFLVHLASLYWGERRAQAIADAWEAFEAGYSQYPLNIMFSYYGPMHDGPVWALSLLPRNFSLPRSWQTLDPTDGDRIGECLLNGHTLDEAITLAMRLSDQWARGFALMRDAGGENREQLSVAEALDILFHSGLNILRFYAMRERLGLREGDPHALLVELRALVEAEKANSRRLIALCEADGRLGYHSEGEGYKYFPKKLRWRIDALERLLTEEFPIVEARLARGLAPLAYYAGEETDGLPVYHMRKANVETAQWTAIGAHAAFRAAYDADTLTLEFRSAHAESVRVAAEFRLMWPSPPVTLLPNGQVRVQSEAYLYYSAFGERLARLLALWQVEKMPCETGMRLRATLSREAAGWTTDRPMKLRLAMESGALWSPEAEPTRTLGKSTASPGEFGWLLPDRSNEASLS